MSEVALKEDTTKAVAKRKAATSDVSSQVQSEAAAIISMLERAARDPQVDIVKMERLFEMAERVRAREAEAAYNTAMAAAQAALVPVAKNQYNDQTKSKYADLAAIIEVAMPIINKHGFGISHSEFKSDREGHMGVACDVMHTGGHSKHYEFHVPVDGTGMKGNPNKTATHAYGSTFMYGRRYATCGVFNIATKEDNDGNGASAADDKITQEQADKIKSLIVDVGADIQRFLHLGGVECVEDIPASQYQKAIDLLEAKRRRK